MAKTDNLNLVPAIREIEAQIRDITTDFEAKIKPYKDSLGALRKVN